jgi:hypothetical protein
MTTTNTKTAELVFQTTERKQGAKDLQFISLPTVAPVDKRLMPLICIWPNTAEPAPASKGEQQRNIFDRIRNPTYYWYGR